MNLPLKLSKLVSFFLPSPPPPPPPVPLHFLLHLLICSGGPCLAQGQKKSIFFGTPPPASVHFPSPPPLPSPLGSKLAFCVSVSASVANPHPEAGQEECARRNGFLLFTVEKTPEICHKAAKKKIARQTKFRDARYVGFGYITCQLATLVAAHAHAPNKPLTHSFLTLPFTAIEDETKLLSFPIKIGERTFIFSYFFFWLDDGPDQSHKKKPFIMSASPAF